MQPSRENLSTVPAASVGPPASPELHELLYALQAVRDGDFSVRLPGHWMQLHGKIADTFNEITTANERMARELDRVGRVVGRQGKTRQRVKFGHAAGAWGEMEASRQHAHRRPDLADD